jgi:hypothetical protein
VNVVIGEIDCFKASNACVYQKELGEVCEGYSGLLRC